MNHIAQRIAVFIDTSNLYHSAKHMFGRRVHFAHLLETAIAGRIPVRMFGYVVTTETQEEKNFLDQLRTLGIELRTKDLQIFSNGNKKADWDVGMSIDAVTLADKIDVAVLVTGDGDFVPLVQYLQSRGVRVECMSFGGSTAQRLRDSVDVFVDMGNDQKRYLISSGRVSRRRISKPRIG